MHWNSKFEICSPEEALADVSLKFDELCGFPDLARNTTNPQNEHLRASAQKKKIKLGILQAEREEPVPALVQQDRMPQALMRPIHFIQKVLNDITKVMGPHCIASFPNHIRS